MAYRKDFRCVVNQLKGGMSWNEALELFLISRQTSIKLAQDDEVIRRPVGFPTKSIPEAKNSSS